MAVNKFYQPDSIIFDLDGTLWDASASCMLAWNQALKQMGGSCILGQEAIRSFSGLPIEKIVKKHFEFIPDQDHKALLEIYRMHEKQFMKSHGGELYPGVKQVLTELSEAYRLFIVSNCLAGYIENFLEFHQLFTDLESSGRTKLSKAENIQLIIARNNIRKPIYVGDTHWDYEAAQKAGVPFVYASYGFGKAEDAPVKIKDITELKGLIKG